MGLTMDERMYSGVSKQFEMMKENSQRAWTGNFVRQKLFAVKKQRTEDRGSGREGKKSFDVQ